MPEQLSKWGPEIYPKSIKIKVWTPRCPLAYSHVPWIAPMVPKDAKVEPAPKVIPLDGKGGPAAMGVALKSAAVRSAPLAGVLGSLLSKNLD